MKSNDEDEPNILIYSLWMLFTHIQENGLTTFLLLSEKHFSSILVQT